MRLAHHVLLGYHLKMAHPKKRILSEFWQEMQGADAAFLFLLALPFGIAAVAFIADWVRSALRAKRLHRAEQRARHHPSDMARLLVRCRRMIGAPA